MPCPSWSIDEPIVALLGPAYEGAAEFARRLALTGQADHEEPSE